MIDLDVAKKNLHNFALIHIIKDYLRPSKIHQLINQSIFYL